MASPPLRCPTLPMQNQLEKEAYPRRHRRPPNFLSAKGYRCTKEHGTIGGRCRVVQILRQPSGEGIRLRQQLNMFKSHSLLISTTNCIVTGAQMCLTQARSSNASATVALLLRGRTAAKNVGAMDCTLSPCMEPPICPEENRLPIAQVEHSCRLEEGKRSLLRGPRCPVMTRVLPDPPYAQRNPSSPEIDMPSLPRSHGLVTRGHATLHLPPATTSVPAQMNARRSLLMTLIAQGERQISIEVWTGIAHNVAFTSVVRPATFSICPFHPGMRAATLSMIGCSCDLVSLLTESGTPK